MIEVKNYLPILIFFIFALGLAVFMVILPIVVSKFSNRFAPDAEKFSTYECGFNPIGDTRGRFDIKFYLVAILFIIFDLEIAFLFPWAIALKTIGPFGFFSMLAFLTVLTVGFIYEWRQGALDW